MFRECLAVVRRQHTMLRASNALTPSLQTMYETIVRMAEGEKGVAWADLSQQSVDNGIMDVSTSTFSNTQLALFDNFVSHASPVRNFKEVKNDRDQSPSPSTIGILTNSVCKTHTPRCPRGSPEKRPPPATPVSMETPTMDKNSLQNGLSPATKPGTPLFGVAPHTSFTPRNYLKFHPLSENRSQQQKINFTPLFLNRPDNFTSKAIEGPNRRNGFASPSIEFNPSIGKMPMMKVPPYLSPKSLVVDSSTHSPPKPAFLPYTTLAAVSKPRAPTPIDDGSWSSSQSSTYTKINSVLRRKDDRTNPVKRGHSFQTDSSSGSSSLLTSTKGRRPEPYLLPRPLPRASEFRTITPMRTRSNTRTPIINGNTPLRKFEQILPSETITPLKNSSHTPVHHTSVSRTMFHTFEDNFVSPAVKTTPMGSDRGSDSKNVAQTLLYPTSPSHSPSPTSSSLRYCRHTHFKPSSQYDTVQYLLKLFLCSSQSLSQDPPSSVSTSNISGITSPSIARTTATSPVATVVHSVGRSNAGSAIPTSTTFKQPRRVKSPSPLKAYKISPSRKAKSTENLSVHDKEEAPVQTKKISSPGKLARAKKLFGFGRSNVSTLQSTTSLIDVTSLTPPGPDPIEEDLSNPIGVSLSEGDADALNATYVVEKSAPLKGHSSREKRNGFPRKRGLLNIGNRPQQLGGHHIVGGSGEDKHRAGGE